MDADNTSSGGPSAHIVAHKSWVPYFRLLVLAALLFGVALPFAFQWNEIAAAVVMGLSVLIVGYRFLLIRSVVLYYDDVGIWVAFGVLPWKKGVMGVKWRDMDEATYAQGFWSWVSRSYTIRIGHRYTKASEILLTEIGGGKNAVSTINGQHQAMIRSGHVN